MQFGDKADEKFLICIPSIPKFEKIYIMIAEKPLDFHI